MFITLFARKEPTNDPVSLAYGVRDKFDTVLYEDRACTRVRARFGWFMAARPSSRTQKRVTLDCCTWALEWV